MFELVPTPDDVYAYLFNHVKDTGMLPNDLMITYALGMTKGEVAAAIQSLRKEGRIEPTTLLPVEYNAWWREHVAAPGEPVAGAPAAG